MRYAWEYSQQYIKEYSISSLVKFLAPFFIHSIRIWDRLSADRVDHFVANSEYIAKRINKYYRREAEVIYPFIQVNDFYSNPVKEDFYLAYGRLTNYKKFDLLVEAFNQNQKKLIICGSGPQLNYLKKIAKENITIMGYTPQPVLNDLLSKAKGLIFPQIEDFGIIPLEAMASGCPVIAYGKGGVLETVRDQKDGLYFEEQSIGAINKTIDKFEEKEFNIDDIREHAKKFDISAFNQQILALVQNKLNLK